MAHKNFQPETPILKAPVVVGKVDLSKFEKQPKAIKTDITTEEPAIPIVDKKWRNLEVAPPDSSYTVGSVIRKHFGFIYVDKDGNIKSTKK